MEQTECCLGGIRLSGVLRPKQVASVGAQTKTRAWAFRLSSSCLSSVSHACCKWLPPPAVPYHTPLRARLSTPNNDPVARNAQYITNKSHAKRHEKTTWFEAKSHEAKRNMVRGLSAWGKAHPPSNQSANRSMVTRGQEPKLTSIPSLHFVTIEQFVFQAAYHTNFILRRLTRPRTVLFFRVIS